MSGRADLEWVPTLYEGYQTAWSEQDGGYIARVDPKENGVLGWVNTYGDTREEAVAELIVLMPDIALMAHRDLDDAIQRARKAEGLADAPCPRCHYAPDMHASEAP